MKPPQRQNKGGQRKQLGQAWQRRGRKKKHARILFTLPGDANTNKHDQTAHRGGHGRERGEVVGAKFDLIRIRKM